MTVADDTLDVDAMLSRFRDRASATAVAAWCGATSTTSVPAPGMR